MVTVLLKTPDWFFGVDSGFQLFTFLVMFGIFLVSIRAYKMMRDEKHRYFVLAFGSLALGFLVRGIVDITLFMRFNAGANALQSSQLFVGGYIAHIMLTLFGYLFLVMVTLGLYKRKDVMALFVLMLIPLFLSSSYFTAFYLLSLILLSFISYHFYLNCRHKKTCAPWFVFSAFLVITLAQALYLCELFHPVFYMVGYGAQQVGYILLLLALLRVIR